MTYFLYIYFLWIFTKYYRILCCHRSFSFSAFLVVALLPVAYNPVFYPIVFLSHVLLHWMKSANEIDSLTNQSTWHIVTVAVWVIRLRSTVSNLPNWKIIVFLGSLRLWSRHSEPEAKKRRNYAVNMTEQTGLLALAWAWTELDSKLELEHDHLYNSHWTRLKEREEELWWVNIILCFFNNVVTLLIYCYWCFSMYIISQLWLNCFVGYVTDQ